ncbi:MAG: tRNA (adenosine(37)-N6)-threonylcarbamoyltransferase complex transferase subunit TsaD [bacterium]|nr:tRNA (adenosine(37)-N6)-threonylcarbamoyltransferase complex transferase subunit TsaD [bacterium]
MKNIICLAIETSCDETSMSLIRNGEEELATIVLSQIDIHANYGGVVPEIASRSHVENITLVLDELLKKTSITLDDVDIIGIANAPGLIGSLLVGLQVAKTLSWLLNKPLIPVHHIAGHIYAANLEQRLEFPLIALVVSGGHTELIYMDKDYSFKQIGNTLDDAIGECYDKVAKILGLPYPGGPLIDALASTGKDTYQLPLPLNDNTYNFSFSGIKSAVLNLVNQEKMKNNLIIKENIATSFQNRVLEIIVKKTIHAINEYKVRNLVVAGGVAANKELRRRLSEYTANNNIKLFIPSIKYCTDNAAMVGSAAYYAYLRNKTADLSLDALSVKSLYQE